MAKSGFGKSALDFLKKGASKIGEQAVEGLDKAFRQLNKGVGKRAKAEHERFKKLPVVRPGRGDVLICKEWGFLDEDDDLDEDRIAPLITQALFLRKRGGTMFSEHAALSVGQDETDDTWICHSNGAGVHKDKLPDRDMVVYRCTIVPLRFEAAHIALVLTGQQEADYGEKPKPGGYGGTKAVKSLFKAKRFGSGARKYLEGLHDLVYGKENPTGMATLRPKAPAMFCSELVAACYVLAADYRGYETSSLRVDPRAMTPKGLEALLEQSSGVFRKTGRVAGTGAPYV